MAKDKITQKDVIDPKIVETFADLNKELETSVRLMAVLTKESIDLSKAFDPKVIQDVTDNQKKYNEAVEKSSKVNTDATTTADKLRKKIKEVSAEEEKLKIQLQKRRKEVRENIKAEKAETNSINDLNRKNKILRERIKNVSTETVGGQKRLKAYNRAIETNSAKIHKASDAYTKQKQNIGNYKSVLKGLGSSLGIVTGGFALMAAAIRKGIQIIGKAIVVNRDFEKSFTNVLTLLDRAQKEEFGLKLEKGAIDLIANYGLEIEDTNKALFDTISAGIEAGDAIDFMNKAAKLAIAGNAELSDVVDGATNIINAYGDEIKNVDDVFNGFFAAQVEGKTDVAALASNIGKLAPIAASVDFGFNELLGTTALLTKQIGSTEEATTILRQVMASIVKPGDAAKATFDKLGISYGATAIKQEGFLNIFKQVTEAAEDNQDVLAELIPNIRALTGASALSEEQFAELDIIISELNDTELSSIKLQDAFNLQMQTSAKQAELLSGRWTRLVVTIGGGESIFKKVGTAIRASLSNEIDALTEKIDIFRTTWSRLTGSVTATEYRDALLEIKTRFNDITIETKKNTEATEEAVVVTEKSTEATVTQAKTISDLNTKIAELQETKNGLAVTDLKGIEDTNKQIKAIQDQIKVLNDLGIKEEEIVKIKETADEDILELIEKQNEKELEILDEKLTDEIDLLLGKEEEKFMTVEEMRQQDIMNQQEADAAKKQSTRDYINFAAQAAQSLTTSISSLLIQDIENQKNADVEKAKQRGASEATILKIEQDAAKKKKNIALTEAIINTALGVTSALTGPYPLSLVMAVLAAAAGAIEIATISSASFAKGTKDSGSGWLDATVGEAGTERINFADGTSMYTPDGATKMLLPPHSEVVTNNQLQRDLADMQMSGVKRSTNDLEKQRKKDQKELIKAIKNRDETTINITENGLTVTAKRGINRITYINSQYRN